MENLKLFGYFLKLGVLGFGGPLALVSMMQKDLVEDRKWVTQAEFEQALALIKALPGALALSTATYLGRKKGGVLGGTLAALGLILPTFLIMIVLGEYYTQFRSATWFQSFFTGLQGGALALIAYSLYQLARPSLRLVSFWIIFVLGTFIFYFHLGPEPFWILFFGFCMVLWKKNFFLKNKLNSFVLITPILSGGGLALQSMDAFEKNQKLFWICFKAGALVFGSGLAMIPIFEKDFVQQLHWLSSDEFFDAVAFGQMTPGPVLMTTTWIGYRLNGLAGATAATVGVFLPSFFHMQTWFPVFMSRMSKMTWIQDFVKGAISFILAALFVVCVQTFAHQSKSLTSVISILLALFLVFKWKLKSWQVLLACGLFTFGIGFF